MNRTTFTFGINGHRGGMGRMAHARRDAVTLCEPSANGVDNRACALAGDLAGKRTRKCQSWSIHVVIALLLFCGLALLGAPESGNTAQERGGAVANAGSTRQSQASEFNGMVRLPGNVALAMVKVRAGSFYMFVGGKRCQVKLACDYWLGRTEVTQKQYLAVMGINPAVFTHELTCPVENVSWNDAMEFCEKLNSLYSEKLPEGYKFCLPTEAQWEYAARGGNIPSSRYSGGNDCDTCTWHGDNSDGMTHAVGQKQPNALGFCDMSGNVWEWCLDAVGILSNDAAAVSDDAPLTGAFRVYRGGSWNSVQTECQTGARYCFFPSYRHSGLGFRLALVSEDGETDTAQHDSASGDVAQDEDRGSVKNEEQDGRKTLLQVEVDYRRPVIAEIYKFSPEPLGISANGGFILKRGGEYDLHLRKKIDGNTCVRDLSFTADWSGVRRINVSLERIRFEGDVTLPGNVSLEMRKIESGGSTSYRNSSEAGIPRKVYTMVTMRRDFWLGAYEVTQRQYKAVMGINPSSNKGDRYPVENVTWNDADGFCEELNRLCEGMLPDGYAFRLPTCEEWIYAARGGNKSKNYNYSGGNDLDEVAWHDRNSHRTTHKVGQKKPNELGLYDMSGNVWEWCDDVGDEGKASRNERGILGGGWNSDARSCQSTSMDKKKPTIARDYCGFRLALAYTPGGNAEKETEKTIVKVVAKCKGETVDIDGFSIQPKYLGMTTDGGFILEKDASYDIRIASQKDDDDYQGKLSFKAGWEGVRQKKVMLKQKKSSGSARRKQQNNR